MTELVGDGLAVTLPRGFEGELRARPAPSGDGLAPAAVDGGTTLHVANFALPPVRGDYGGGAVELMGPDHVFVSLVEFGPESVGTPLFAERPIPLLRSEDFDPFALQRVLAGQAGTQVFFSRAGRAFCLYVVLGRDTLRFPLVRSVNAVTQSLRVSER